MYCTWDRRCAYERSDNATWRGGQEEHRISLHMFRRRSSSALSINWNPRGLYLEGFGQTGTTGMVCMNAALRPGPAWCYTCTWARKSALHGTVVDAYTASIENVCGHGNGRTFTNEQ